jgi:transglutaminase-like putative cysteine protease
MHLKIVHTTRYDYEEQVAASYNEVRLSPLTQDGQLVTQNRVEVTPKPWTYSYRDYWGAQVTAFEVLEPHQALTVTGASIVHTSGAPSRHSTVTWEQLAEAADGLADYLMILDRARLPAELLEIVAGIRADSPTPADAVEAICELIHREVSYRPRTTDVGAGAADAWAARSGVCQDIAHLAIGCLRAMAIPTRYVSGYLHPDAEPELGVPIKGESHAWIEWWSGEWRGYDPTNRVEPGERHVAVAKGRNYDDVRPVAGVYTGGGGASRMSVTVEITRLP